VSRPQARSEAAGARSGPADPRSGGREDGRSVESMATPQDREAHSLEDEEASGWDEPDLDLVAPKDGVVAAVPAELEGGGVDEVTDAGAASESQPGTPTAVENSAREPAVEESTPPNLLVEVSALEAPNGGGTEDVAVEGEQDSFKRTGQPRMEEAEREEESAPLTQEFQPEVKNFPYQTLQHNDKSLCWWIRAPERILQVPITPTLYHYTPRFPSACCHCVCACVVRCSGRHVASRGGGVRARPFSLGEAATDPPK
jgi:hypothetical protein